MIGEGVGRRAISDLTVVIRAHRAVPALAVQKVVEACARPDIGLWKLHLAVLDPGEGEQREELLLPYYRPKDPSPPDRAAELVVDYERAPAPATELTEALHRWGTDVSGRAAAAHEQPDAAREPVLHVVAAGEVRFGAVVTALEHAMEAGAAALDFRVEATAAQRLAWAENQDLEVLVAATAPAPARPPRMVLERENERAKPPPAERRARDR